MKLVVQKVKFAKVSVNNNSYNSISQGMLVYVGISKNCNVEKIEKMAKKLLNLKLFPDSSQKNFKKNIEESKGELLLISQFTLHGDCSKKNNPQFTNSAQFSTAKKFYDLFVEKITEQTNCNVKTGIFGEQMEIESCNDGPITLLLEQ